MPEQSAEEKAALVAQQVANVDNLLSEGDPAAVLGAIGNIAAVALAPAASDSTKSDSDAAAEPSAEEQQQMAAVGLTSFVLTR